VAQRRTRGGAGRGALGEEQPAARPLTGGKSNPGHKSPSPVSLTFWAMAAAGKRKSRRRSSPSAGDAGRNQQIGRRAEARPVVVVPSSRKRRRRPSASKLEMEQEGPPVTARSVVSPPSSKSGWELQASREPPAVEKVTTASREFLSGRVLMYCSLLSVELAPLMQFTQLAAVK
jgi:hypothetical protein